MEYQATISADKPIVITIGNFDGIHLGHQRLLHEVGEIARTLQCKPVLVTFSPHTLLVVRPEMDIRYLTTLDEKLALAKQYGGIADSIVITFTPAVVAMSAEEFMDYLRQHFCLRGIVVGADFSLGHNRMGNVEFLQQYGQQHQIFVHAIPLAEADRSRISSTRVRTLVKQGDVAGAYQLLGHPMIVSGIVGRGAKRGRLLGFPTANLHPEPHKLLPADGVYAAMVHIQDGQDRDLCPVSHVYKGVVNIGTRPTFDDSEHLIEVHLLNANFDLYDRKLTVELIERLRGEQRFPNVEALKAQISADVQSSQNILAEREKNGQSA